MSPFDPPVAKRTRHQWNLYYLSLHGTSSRKRNKETGIPQSGSTRQDFHQEVDVDECLDKNKDSETSDDQYDSDDTYVPEEQEEADKGHRISSKYHHESTSDTKACPFQVTKDDPLSSSESESESDDESFCSIPNKSLKQSTTKKQSPMDINPIYISSDTDESEKEGSDAGGKAVQSDGVEELDISEFEKTVLETEGYNSEDSIKTETPMHFVYPSDDSDDKKEEADGSQNSIKADSFQYHEDDEGFQEAGPSRLASVKKSYNIDEESKKEESNTEPEESDGLEEADISEFEKTVMETEGYNSKDSIRTGKHIYFVYSSDDSDSDDIKEGDAS